MRGIGRVDRGALPRVGITPAHAGNSFIPDNVIIGG